MTAAQKLGLEVRLLAVETIDENKSNPRVTFDETKLTELAADVAKNGVLQPLLVRPVGKRFEVVFGHRRLRAAKIADVETVPVIVRELTDAKALELALVENLQRDDLNALEEADGYSRLHKEHGLSIDDIAAKVSKSRAWVYARLRLIALVKPAREAFLAGKLTSSTALLIARMPEQLQAKAAKEIATPRYADGDAMTYREAASHVRRNFMLELAKAPFDATDAELYPTAGACTTCPSRTGAQPELFGDVKEKDICANPICYRAKVDADWKSRETEAAAGRGPKVVSAKESKAIFQDYGLKNDAPYVDVTANCHDDEKWRSYKELLGKAAKAHIVVARNLKGEVVELVPKEGLKKVLDDVGRIKRRKGQAAAKSTKEDKAAREREAKKAAVRREAVNRAVGLIVAKVEVMEFDKKWWRMLADQLLHDAADRTIERRFPEDDPKAPVKWLEKASAEQLRGFVFECVMERVLYPFGTEKPKLFVELCAAFGVDLKKLEGDVKEAEKAFTNVPTEFKVSVCGAVDGKKGAPCFHSPGHDGAHSNGLRTWANKKEVKDLDAELAPSKALGPKPSKARKLVIHESEAEAES